MKRILAVLAVLLLSSGVARATGSIDIVLRPDPQNPATPRMGDQLKFESVIANTGTKPARGLVAWISLVEVTPGHEQPMDLEDWSAHKAVTRANLAPGESFTVDWPMRLIQAGDYRVVISAVERSAGRIISSPFVDFSVHPKPVVESSRILPVAFGVPLLIGGLLGWRIRRRASSTP
jgi:hypothetical protein